MSKRTLAQCLSDAKRDGWADWIRSERDERAVLNGCRFDIKSANRPIRFFSKYLRHTMGTFEGKPFDLMDWQRLDVIMPAYGWLRENGSRRYRRVFVFVPKKNGKSTFCGGLVLYHLTWDNEPRAHVFGGASDREQASIVYEEAASLVRSSPALKKILTIIDSRKRIVWKDKGCIYRVLSADAFRQEGLNFSGFVFDELHAQRNRTFFDAIRYGGAARKQPLIWEITTAGEEKSDGSICYEEYDYACKVRDGLVEDDSFLPYICEAKEDDDWTSEDTWIKANPSINQIIQLDEMREACKEAQASPTKEYTFKRYRLNQWPGKSYTWTPMNEWRAINVDINVENLIGRECYGGLDASSTSDITAFVLVFPNPDGSFDVLCWFWVPKKNAEKRQKNRITYMTWADEGWIELTDGAAIDTDVIEKKIYDELSKKFIIKEIAYDPHNALTLAQHLETKGLTMVEFRQGILSFNEPMKRTEELILKGKLHHGNNPVLTWMASNISGRKDANDNVAPDKKKSAEKIDGMVSLIMAVGRAILHDPPKGKSVYETRGIISVGA